MPASATAALSVTEALWPVASVTVTFTALGEPGRRPNAEPVCSVVAFAEQ